MSIVGLTAQEMGTLNRIRKSLTKHDRDHNSSGYLYTISWEYQGTKETYLFAEDDLVFLTMAIHREHPVCSLYMESLLALEKAEGPVKDISGKFGCQPSEPESRFVWSMMDTKFGRRPKWPCDATKYMEIKKEMLTLGEEMPPYEDGTIIMKALASIGVNPTQGLNPNPAISKSMASRLINRQWKSKNDFNSPIKSIRAKMIDDILKDPVKAFQENTYLYAFLRKYCSSSL